MSRLTTQAKKIKKGALFCAPFVLFFAAAVCFFLWLGSALISGEELSQLYQLLFRSSSASGSVEIQKEELIAPKPLETDVIEGEFVMPLFATQWATMNVDGWKERDIPVYYGNSDEVLRAGAAQAQFSRFAGQGGKVVLSAHVNLEFYEIEDSAARFESGEEVLVTLDTLWGTYVYRVEEVVIFDHLDATPLLPEEGEESLFFYTCYPRENSLAYKTERIGLKCSLVEGATWRDYVR